MSVNKVILVGRLGQNPETRFTPGGSAVSNFSIATSESWMDKAGQKQERTEWHRIVVWGKLAELCQQYLAKGRQVYIEGKLQTRQWQDQAGQTKYTTEVQAQTVQFLGANAGTSAGAGYNESAPGFSAQGAGMGNTPSSTGPASGGEMNAPAHFAEPTFTEDDIPF